MKEAYGFKMVQVKCKNPICKATWYQSKNAFQEHCSLTCKTLDKRSKTVNIYNSSSKDELFRGIIKNERV